MAKKLAERQDAVGTPRRRGRFRMWQIETRDAGGYGLHIWLCRTKEEALAKIPPTMEVLECYSVLGIELAEIEDKELRTNYRRIVVELEKLMPNKT